MADASIYSLIRPFQPAPDPIQQYGQALNLKTLMGQQGLQEIQMQQARKSMDDESALSKLFAGGRTPTEQEVMAISPKRGMEYGKALVDRQKSEAEAAKLDRENFVSFADQARKRMATTNPETWAQFRDEQIQLAGMFKTPAVRQAAMSAASSMPPQFDPNFIRNSLVKAEELFTPKFEKVDTGGKVEMVDVNPFTNPAIRDKQFNKTQTPDSVASVGATIRGQNMTDSRARDANDISKGTKVNEQTDSLRKEFEGKDSVKRYRDVIPIAEAARQSPDTRAGDIQLAYAVGKILDPNSVVREGELALVGNAATLPEKLQGEIRTLVMGKGRMTPATRSELQTMLDSAVGQRKNSYDAERKSYEGIVSGRGLKASDVFVETQQLKPNKAPAITKVINGKTYVQQNGQWFEQN